MKTTYELQYEEHIISMIIFLEESREKQISLLIDFHQNAAKYYEDLCDAVYALSVRRRDQALCLSPSGKPFFSASGAAGEGIVLCFPAEVPEFKDDLIAQLEFVIRQLKMLSKTVLTAP